MRIANTSWRWLGALALAGALAVTDRVAAQEAEPPPPATTGRIVGLAKFAGTVVPPAELHAHHDPEVCAKGGPLLDERRLVAADGALANVVVVLQGMPATTDPAATATLDQRACRFVPHVQAVTQGTALAITSSDPVLHNVHAFLGKRTAFNLAIPVPGKTVTRKLDEPGILRIRCDSGHTWMSAYVAVVPHRYHAVSAPDGSFTIADVPPGEYKLRAWQEDLGAVEQTVTVTAGGDAAVSVTFREPDQDAPAAAPDDELKVALAATRSAIERLDAERRAAERDRLAREGEPLFHKFCATCHGRRGDGRGPSARFTTTPPRDFTRGTYKFRMTPAGSPPTHADLVRTISVGVRGTHMPAWKGTLSRSQIATLARFLTTRADVFWTSEPPPPPLEIPAEPPYDDASVARGKELYAKMQCATCHGERGRGDGPAASALKDDWGHAIRPADFTAGAFKGGCCGATVFRAISTGLGGTPMPSFAAAMTPAERWDLAHYVLSLGHTRPATEYLLAPVGRITPP